MLVALVCCCSLSSCFEMECPRRLIFTCVAALTLLRLIELRLRRAGLELTAKSAMRSLHSLHSCLMWSPGAKKPERLLEKPDETQAQILRAFGWKIVRGVLQQMNG